MENGNIVVKKTGQANDSLEEKRKIVAELYTLRAGLSEVAAEVDAKREIERTERQKIEALESQTINASEERRQAKEQLRLFYIDRERAAKITPLKEKARKEIEFLEQRQRRQVWIWRVSIAICLVGWILFPEFGLLGLDKTSELRKILDIVCGLLMGVSLIVVPVAIWRILNIKCGETECGEEINRLRKDMNGENPNSALYEPIAAGKRLIKLYGDFEYIDWVETRLNSRIQQCKETEKKLSKEIEQLEAALNTSDDIPLHEETAKRIYATLEEQYASLVDPRDWENLDIIIYSYETGRADTIKEALSQVDAVRRTEQIVAEIRKAAQNVAASIRQGARSLEYSMQSSMARLADGLAEQNRALLSSQNEFQQKVGARLSQIATSAELSTALQQKAELNSREIMAQIGDLQANSNFERYGV